MNSESRSISHQNTKIEKGSILKKISLRPSMAGQNEDHKIFPISKFRNLAKITKQISNEKELNEIKTARRKSCSKTINFIKQIKLLKKIANTFKFRTKFRTLDNLAESKIDLLNDVTYFSGKHNMHMFLKRFTEKNVSFFFFDHLKKKFSSSKELIIVLCPVCFRMSS